MKLNIPELDTILQTYLSNCKLNRLIQTKTQNRKNSHWLYFTDIWNHVASGFCDSLFTKYGRSKFEVILFHYDWHTDAQKWYMRPLISHRTSSMNEQALFDAIYDENLDIIIDLAAILAATPYLCSIVNLPLWPVVLSDRCSTLRQISTI